MRNDIYVLIIQKNEIFQYSKYSFYCKLINVRVNIFI